MAKYIPDISSRRWVIISQSRISRPTDENPKKKQIDPFAEGNEAMTGSEVLRYGRGEKNKPGWKVRVVPNKYPITDLHEVIIHTPDPHLDIDELASEQVELIFTAYRERYNFYKKKGQVLIFCNHGEHAGASLTHPHSQLVVIPFQINIDVLPREPMNNIIEQNKYFNMYCPDFSQWPYEVWIAPKEEKSCFGDITEKQIPDLVRIVQKLLKRMKEIYAESSLISVPFGYNYYIYPGKDWYLRLIPRFIHRAGFELGTGLSVNIIDPAEAALEMKGIGKSMMQVMDKLKEKSSRHL